VRDLQHRLDASGFRCEGDDDGTFGDATFAAVRAFQLRRGLDPSGLCDATTWDALVEAGWRLGDRPLYLTNPMLRGDDVADLQRNLGALGFDAGRVDGIFGPDTDRALTDFQRNAGLVADAICGPATVGALARLGPPGDLTASVADVKERERFRCGPRSLAGRTIAIAHDGGLDALASSTARGLRLAGAAVSVLQHPEPSELAATANATAADVLVCLRLERPENPQAPVETGCRVAYYRSPAGWESPGGKLLAKLTHDALSAVVEECVVAPMSLPVLRETRMPAVTIALGPPPLIVERTAEIAAALPVALQRWASEFGT
jgi:N-acetylmuramoyl-L-alanine amidase